MTSDAFSSTSIGISSSESRDIVAELTISTIFTSLKLLFLQKCNTKQINEIRQTVRSFAVLPFTNWKDIMGAVVRFFSS